MPLTIPKATPQKGGGREPYDASFQFGERQETGDLANIRARRRSRPPSSRRKRCWNLRVVRPALGVDLTALGEPDLSEADHQPTKQAESEGGLGTTHAAVILAQGHVQGVMQSAFNHPVAAFEFEEARRIHLRQRETADQGKPFRWFFWPWRRTRRRSRPMVCTPGKPTRWAKPRDSPAPGSRGGPGCARASGTGRVCGVGERGKTLVGEERFQRGKEVLLVLFDRQEVVTSLVVGEFCLACATWVWAASASTILSTRSNGANCSRPVGISLRLAGTSVEPSQRPLPLTALTGLHVSVADFLAVDNHQRVLHRPQHLLLPEQQHPLQQRGVHPRQHPRQRWCAPGNAPAGV